MFYDIRFDGDTVKDICCREYESDLHAINAAYKALNEQQWTPESVVQAEIYKGEHKMQDCEYFVTVFVNGWIRFYGGCR